MSTLERAIAISAEAHAGQVDKNGEPYILHPLRVMLAMESDVGRIVGVLHDVSEDCPGWPPSRLAREGFSTDVLAALEDLARPKLSPVPSYSVYIDCLARFGTPVARAVKIADLEDNLRYDRMKRLSIADCERLQGRYRPALKLLTAATELRGARL